MCSRYWTEESPELRAIVEQMNRSPLVGKWQNTTAVKTYGEMRPTDVVPVIAPNRSGERAVYPMKWGYTGKSLLINARSETAADKPTFRDDWARHRCIIPASWYYEWEHVPTPSGKSKAGDKYAIMPKGGELTWLCGLYRLENNFPHFVILTREPGDSIAFIHDRMPFILPESKVDFWIDPERNPHMLLGSAITDVVFEKDERGNAL